MSVLLCSEPPQYRPPLKLVEDIGSSNLEMFVDGSCNGVSGRIRRAQRLRTYERLCRLQTTAAGTLQEKGCYNR